MISWYPFVDSPMKGSRDTSYGKKFQIYFTCCRCGTSYKLVHLYEDHVTRLLYLKLKNWWTYGPRKYNSARIYQNPRHFCPFLVGQNGNKKWQHDSTFVLWKRQHRDHEDKKQPYNDTLTKVNTTDSSLMSISPTECYKLNKHCMPRIVLNAPTLPLGYQGWCVCKRDSMNTAHGFWWSSGKIASSVCQLLVINTTQQTVSRVVLHVHCFKTSSKVFCQLCSDLTFIPGGTTDVGLDNNLLHRLQSRKVVLEGYSQINNPNKGLGVIHHSAVSNCTSLYCGGHVTACKKESTIDCIKILLLPHSFE